MNPARPRVIRTSSQVWNLIERDVSLRHSRMVGGWNEQRQRDLRRLDYDTRHRGNSGYYLPTRVDLEIKETTERAESLYSTCCEVADIHAIKKNREFYRAVFDRCLVPLFAARRSTVQSELQHRDVLLRTLGNCSATLGHLSNQMSQLRADWNTRLEIEARDSETRERVIREDAVLPPANQTQSAPSFVKRSGHERMTTLKTEQIREAASIFTWKELAQRFRDVQAKTTVRNVFSATFTRTEWESGSINEEWIVGGNRVLVTEFEQLASIAARKLGFASNDYAYKDWLGRVREWIQEAGLDTDRSMAWRPSGFVYVGGITGKTQSLVMDRVADLSAMFCLELLTHGTPESAVSPLSSQNQPQTAQADQSSAKRPLLNKYRSEIKRAILIQLTKNPSASDLELCRGLDADGAVEMPASWSSERQFVKVYRDPSQRRRVEITISKVRADLRKQGLMD